MSSPGIRASGPASRASLACARPARNARSSPAAAAASTPIATGPATASPIPPSTARDLLKLISHIGSRLPAPARGGTAGTPAHVAQRQPISGRWPRAPATRQPWGSSSRPSAACVRGLLGAVYQAAMATPDVPRRGQGGAAGRLVRADHSRPRAARGPGRGAGSSLRSRLGHALAGAAAAGRGLATVTDPGRDHLEAGRRPGHLGAIAAAAAIRARMRGRVTVPVMDGAVHLPTLGGSARRREAAAGGLTARPGDRDRQRHRQRGHHRGRRLMLDAWPGRSAGRRVLRSRRCRDRRLR